MTDSDKQAPVEDRLRTLAERWLAAAAERRKVADAETDKVWSARQYGIADTFEDAALHVMQVLDEGAPDWAAVVAQWSALSEQVLGLAALDDNRITIAYRRSGGEAYTQAIEGLRAALQGTPLPGLTDDLRHLLDENSD